MLGHARPNQTKNNPSLTAFLPQRKNSRALESAVEQPACRFSEDASRGHTAQCFLAETELLSEEQEYHCSDKKVEGAGNRQNESDADACGGRHELANALEVLHDCHDHTPDAEDDHQVEGVVRQFIATQKYGKSCPCLGHRRRQFVAVQRDVNCGVQKAENSNTDNGDDWQYHGLQGHLQARVDLEPPTRVEILTQDAGLIVATCHHASSSKVGEFVHCPGQSADALGDDAHCSGRIEGRIAHGPDTDKVQKYSSYRDIKNAEIDWDTEPIPENRDNGRTDSQLKSNQPLKWQNTPVITADILQSAQGRHSDSPLEQKCCKARSDEECNAGIEELVWSGRYVCVWGDDDKQQRSNYETEAGAYSQKSSCAEEERTPRQSNTNHAQGDEISSLRHPHIALQHENTEEQECEPQDDLALHRVLRSHGVLNDVCAGLAHDPWQPLFHHEQVVERYCHQHTESAC